ncbi:MAG TPA: redoxin domain-containing protein [Polyangiaceae bacterium]|nr:redoxin domain-containing protein [Polyangiaceae bacterium]
MSLARLAWWSLFCGSSILGCSRGTPPIKEEPAKNEARPTTAAMTAPPEPAAAKLENARIGAAAPDFELPDLDGKLVKLSSFRGSTVVLEWFNPGCPFVKASHTKGSLVDTASRQLKNGVVWLAVNSGAPGKQGNGVEANRAGKAAFKLEHPILLDETGRVGHAYGAAHTPHLFIIDPQGVLVYRGAIDNSPDAEGESPTGGKLINYVDATLGDLKAGRPVSVAETEAYGCSVKYAN